jgi:hypothetical protein
VRQAEYTAAPAAGTRNDQQNNKPFRQRFKINAQQQNKQPQPQCNKDAVT